MCIIIEQNKNDKKTMWQCYAKYVWIKNVCVSYKSVNLKLNFQIKRLVKLNVSFSTNKTYKTSA